MIPRLCILSWILGMYLALTTEPPPLQPIDYTGVTIDTIYIHATDTIVVMDTIMIRR